MFDDIDNTPQTSGTPPTPPPQTQQPRPRPIQPMPLQTASSYPPPRTREPVPPPPPRVAPTPPVNLPLGGQPIDAPYQPPAPPPSVPPSPTSPVSLPEDIFNTTDTIPVSPYTQNAPTITPLGGMQEAPSVAVPPPPLPEQSTGGFRKVLVFFLSAAIVAFLGIGAYLVYRIMKTKTGVDVLNQLIESETGGEMPASGSGEEAGEPEGGDDEGGAAVREEEQTEEGPGSTDVVEEENEPASTIDEDKTEPEDAPTEPEPTPEEPEQPPTDSDNDGLSDLEELELGSNPRVIDTDLDGLDDYSEVRVYRSNPVRRDTDGDSYDDGLEVQNGYSPTGPGKLTQ